MKTEILKVPMGKSNSYLITGKKGIILVDAGMPGKSEKVLKALNNFNAKFNDINLIIVTHAHNDHVGSLHDIKKKSNALVLIPEKENNYLKRGYSKFPDGTMIFSKIISGFANNLFFSKDQFEPVKADIIIDDDFDLSNYGVNGRVIYTPGHTEGSISVIIENKYCITGDTLFNMLPNSVYPPFANDEEQLIKSWKKIRKQNCKKYYPGHGREFTLNKFEKTIKKHKKRLMGTIT